MNPIYKVLMFGDRDWTRAGSVRRQIMLYREWCRKHGYELVIIEGGAPGADQLVGYWARIYDVHVAEVKALWDTRHKAAGPQRNAVMAALRPDEAVCFHADLDGSSRGSKSMAKILDNLKISYKVIKR